MKKLCLLAVFVAGLTGSVYSQQVYTDNVVIVLDASGSMAGKMRAANVTRMTAAKQALHQVLKQIPETTHVGLLVFSAENVKDHWVYPLGPRDDAVLSRAIDLPRPKGGTPLGRYIKIGADRLLEERKKQFGYGSYRLLVVTDGEAGDSKIMERNTRLVLQRGVLNLDVIGVDMAGRHTLAKMSHSYRQANDPESLTRAIKEVFAEISTSDGTDSGAEAFEEIASLGAEFAGGVLAGLAVTGNQPIGQGPQSPTPVPVAKKAPIAAVGQPSQHQVYPSNQNQGRRPFKKGPMVFVFIVIAAFVLKKVFRVNRR